ncbi:MAG: hypothetical protein BWZ03_00508 [bacterium ADurb.BinA186]|nr:MAG: hypothetical protein BWZ03_00508 [bacterium ADurb.BinA186]
MPLNSPFGGSGLNDIRIQGLDVFVKNQQRGKQFELSFQFIPQFQWKAG